MNNAILDIDEILKRTQEAQEQASESLKQAEENFEQRLWTLLEDALNRVEALPEPTLYGKNDP